MGIGGFIATAPVLAFIFATGTSIAAHAQTAEQAPPTDAIMQQPQDEEDIRVTGSREGSEAAIDSFVDAVVAETGNGRVARWSDRICLNIEGGPAAHSDYFGARIAEIASEFEIDVLRGRPCEPSAYIVFTREPDRLIQQLNENRPAFFGSISSAQREAFLTSDAPVRWVSHSELRAARGETPMSFYVDPRSGGVERPVPSMRTIPSRIVAGSRMDLQAMLVFVDVSKLSGISYRSLSAYLTMVVLGNVRPDHGQLRQPSILNIFGSERWRGEVTSADLTDWDLAYLSSLYQGNWNMTAEQRLRRIQASMPRNLESQPAEDEARPQGSRPLTAE